MVALFERLGGTLRLDDPAVAIEVAGGVAKAVRTRSGWRGEADAVASNGDIVASYGLIEGDARGAKRVKALKRKRYSPSLFVLHLGIEGEFPEIPHHMILFGPRYEELLGDIYNRGALASDPALYLHHPTVTDPSMAPPGHSTFYALAPVPHLGKARRRLGNRGRALCRVSSTRWRERLIPDIRARIRTRFHYAPSDFGSRSVRPSRLGVQPRAGAVASRRGCARTIATTSFATSISSARELIPAPAFRASSDRPRRPPA